MTDVRSSIIYKKTSDLIPYARNSRTHSDDQVKQIASSISELGFTNPILVDSAGGIIAGHGRIMAAKRLGIPEVPCIVLDHLTEVQKRAYIIADNKLALNAGWDDELLAAELKNLSEIDFDLALTGFSADELSGLLQLEDVSGLTGEDEVPEPPEQPVTVEGDVWVLGNHRLMCGDSTSIDAVEKLMDGQKAALLHADPPYGMGKQADGVANDNLYNDKLDNFQMDWWTTFRAFTTDNGSAYIWGNAPELWRLWYGKLAETEMLTIRAEIVWDKKPIAGMKSGLLTQYPEATERCLFFQIGNQFLGSVNSEDFPESWEPLRAYLAGEAEAAGIGSKEIKDLCGCGMFSHWFTRSQFTLIPEKHYKKLAASRPGNFQRPWKELKAEWDRVKGVLTKEVQGGRSYFDNTHDSMRDVWEFPRVTGAERHTHATPKPVAMMKRVMLSSLPRGGLCAEPFGGSGATLMGAEVAWRKCYTMELQPKYCDVIINRWQDFTGKEAINIASGKTYNQMKSAQIKKAS
jgi:DNA modification methylase